MDAFLLLWGLVHGPQMPPDGKSIKVTAGDAQKDFTCWNWLMTLVHHNKFQR